MKIAKRIATLLVALGVQVLMSAAAPAAQLPQLTLEVSEGRLLTLSGPASSVFLADPNIADIQVPQPNRIFIFGKKAGHTTLHAMSEGGEQIAAYDVTVVHGAKSEQQAVAGLSGSGADVKVSEQDNAVTLSGTAPDAETAAEVTAGVKAVAPTGGQIDATRVKVAGSQQVLLRVWIGEVSRAVTKDLAFNWEAFVNPGSGALSFYTGRQLFNLNGNGQPTSFILPSGDFGSLGGQLTTGRVSGGAFVDALASEGLITTLAEPTLMAISGESASFLAGGQFPIPIVQPGSGTTAISIQYEQYGVSLSFTPTVLASNRISIHVRPEVSEISTEGQVDFSGFVIPGLTIRRAITTVELGSGESFAIAGLLQNTTSTTIQKYPGLGDLPVLGALFRSNNFQHGESELVIIITPYLVKPVDDPNRLRVPTDGLGTPNDLERIFLGRLAVGVPSSVPGGPASTTPAGSVSALTGPRLTGDAGFDLE